MEQEHQKLKTFGAQAKANQMAMYRLPVAWLCMAQ